MMTEASLKSLYRLLVADLAANAGGSGGRAMAWAWLFNPGFSTIALHRLSQHLTGRGFRHLGAWCWVYNLRRSGCHFHPDAAIGAGLSLPHPIGIVIGSGCTVGANVSIYHGVTIGRDRKGGYPVIADGAALLPGVMVIGSVRVGLCALVGANALVRSDVPDHATLVISQTQSIRPGALLESAPSSRLFG